MNIITAEQMAGVPIPKKARFALDLCCVLGCDDSGEDGSNAAFVLEGKLCLKLCRFHGQYLSWMTHAFRENGKKTEYVLDSIGMSKEEFDGLDYESGIVDFEKRG